MNLFCGKTIGACLHWWMSLPVIDKVLLAGAVFVGIFFIIRIVYWICNQVFKIT